MAPLNPLHAVVHHLDNLIVQFTTVDVEIRTAASIHCLVCLFLFLTPLAVWCRIRNSWQQWRRLGYGDGMLLVGLSTYILQGLLTHQSLTKGVLVTPTSDKESLSIAKALKYHLLSQILYFVTTLLLRISAFLTLYPYNSPSRWSLLRVLNGSFPGLMLIAILFLSIEASAAFLTVWTEHCVPRAWFWGRLDYEERVYGVCIKPDMVQSFESRYAMATALFGIASTFASVLIVIRSSLLRMNANNLPFAIATGLLAALSVLLRLVRLSSTSEYEQYSFDSNFVIISSILEPGFMILALASYMFEDETTPQSKPDMYNFS